MVKARSQEKRSETLSSEHESTQNSQMLWLSAQDLHKIELSAFQPLPSAMELLLTANGCWKTVFKGVISGRSTTHQ